MLRGVWLNEMLIQTYITLQCCFPCSNVNGCIVIEIMQYIRKCAKYICIMCHLESFTFFWFPRGAIKSVNVLCEQILYSTFHTTYRLPTLRQGLVVIITLCQWHHTHLMDVTLAVWLGCGAIWPDGGARTMNLTSGL